MQWMGHGRALYFFFHSAQPAPYKLTFFSAFSFRTTLMVERVFTWWLIASSEAEEKFCLAKDMFVCVCFCG